MFRRSARTTASTPPACPPASPTWTPTTSRRPLTPQHDPPVLRPGVRRQDKDLVLACLQIFNDWMIRDWSAGDGVQDSASIDSGPIQLGGYQDRDVVHW